MLGGGGGGVGLECPHRWEERNVSQLACCPWGEGPTGQSLQPTHRLVRNKCLLYCNTVIVEVTRSVAVADRYIRDTLLSYSSLRSQFPHLKSRGSDDLSTRAVVCVRWAPSCPHGSEHAVSMSCY